MNISVRELKSRLSETLRRVAAGEEMIVTSRGKAVACLLPPRRRQRRAAASGEAQAIALLHSQTWIKAGKTGRQRVGLSNPVKLKPGTKPLSETIVEMRD